jgi:hypothetical protein
MVDEAGFIAEAGSVDGPVAVEVEQKRKIFSVIDYTAALCFVGRYDLLVALVKDLIVRGLLINVFLPRRHTRSKTRPCEWAPLHIDQNQYLQVDSRP